MGSKPLSKTKATYLRRLGSSIVCAIAAQNRGELRPFPRVRIFDAVNKKRNRKSAGHKPVALVDFSEQLFYNILIKRKGQYLCRAESPDSPGNGPRLCAVVWLHGHGHGGRGALVPYRGAAGCAGRMASERD